MHVHDLMRTPPVTLQPDAAVSMAQRLMQQHHTHHLAVLDQERLVGVVTDSDIRLSLPSPATSLAVYELRYLLQKLTAGEVMTRQVITVTPDTSITEAVRLMLQHSIGVLPVVVEQRLLGMLMRQDILRTFLALQADLTAVT